MWASVSHLRQKTDSDWLTFGPVFIINLASIGLNMLIVCFAIKTYKESTERVLYGICNKQLTYIYFSFGFFFRFILIMC